MKRTDYFRRRQNPHKDPGVTIERVGEERCFEKHGLQKNLRAGATPV